MRTSDFDYSLPGHLIAQTPLEPRDHSRLLALSRHTGAMDHRYFYDIGEFLQPGDVLVCNDSRVIPARLATYRSDTGGYVEILLLRRRELGVWEAIGRPSRRLRPGMRLKVGGDIPGNCVEIISVEEDGLLVLILSNEDMLEHIGQAPLPPYIHTALADPDRYQTVYAHPMGSAAAPTAGLHFTKSLLRRLQAQGVQLVFATLHIGLDTFRPIHAQDPTQHRIHGEFFELNRDAVKRLNEARKNGRRIIAVGTTSVRLLEQAALIAESEGLSELRSCSGWTHLYILPGYHFKMVDGLVTNFHLPQTTLLMLVCAFAGKELVLETYREAIALSYRFYSFGDGMILL